MFVNATSGSRKGEMCKMTQEVGSQNAKDRCKRGQNTNFCCSLRRPGGERILDIAPGGTELGTQVKAGSQAGRTHSQ